MKTKSTTPIHVLLRRAAVPSLFLACAGFLQAQSFTPLFSNKWGLPADDTIYDLPSTGNNVRGIAVNRFTTNVLYTSTAGGSNHVTVVSGTNGSLIGALDANGVSGGTLALMQVRVADDGVIYACNLSGGDVSVLRIYRWESEEYGLTNPPVMVFNQSGIGSRLGDAMDVRGAGTNTQIAIAGTGLGTNWAIIRPDQTDSDPVNPTNLTWVMTEFSYAEAGLGPQAMGKGITFDATNNNVYGKIDSSGDVVRVAFNIDAATNGLLSIVPGFPTAFVGIKYATNANGVSLLSGVIYEASTGPKVLRVYDFSLGASSSSVATNTDLPPPANADGNGLGASDIGAGLVVGVEPNNGIRVLGVTFAANVPPSITANPAGTIQLNEGGYFTLTVGASGTAPLGYQWYRGSLVSPVLIPNATNTTLNLTNVTLSQAGGYFAIASNVTTLRATSTVAQVTILPSVLSSVTTKLWTLPPGSRTNITTGNTQRGMAVNPVNGNVIFVSRSPANAVVVLDGATGAELRKLNLTDVSGGTFAINMVGVADDGAVYVCNLVTADGAFKIYRWADDQAATVPTVAFGPGTSGLGRAGDTMDVRGSGTGTQIILAANPGNNVTVLTTADGTSFNPVGPIPVSGAPGTSIARLGLAFGEGNTFWGKATSIQLVNCSFDLNAVTGAVQSSLIPPTPPSNFAYTNAAPIGFDVYNKYIATIGILDVPQDVRLYDVIDPAAGALLLDQEFYPTSNANANGTGAVDFDIARGRIFSLDTNNGLMAQKYAGRLYGNLLAGKLVLNWGGPSALQASGLVTGTYTNVPAATSPFTNSISGTAFYRLTN